MPMDNIDRAISKGTGTGEGGALIEMTLEGYAQPVSPSWLAPVTDNRNRTVQEVRSSFTKHGGAMGENGCVSWMFKSRGVMSLVLKSQRRRYE